MKRASLSQGKSYFDHQRARIPTIDNDFGLNNSFTREFNQSPLIDAFDEESDFGIRNPAYDILRGRQLPELPVEIQRPKSPADSTATYASMPMRLFNSSRNLIAEYLIAENLISESYNRENRDLEIEDSSTERSFHLIRKAYSRKLISIFVGKVLQNLALIIAT